MDMRKFYTLAAAFFMSVVLTGCLYPDERLEKNQVPNDHQLQSVQLAVDNYKEANRGQLPIETRNSDTPIFQKYPIDFKKLKQYGFIGSTPGNAFQEGGDYQYVIIHPDENPTVKVLDLRLTEHIRSINTQLQLYRSKHIYPPFGEEIAYGVYEIDFEELGFDEPQYVVSPYTMEHLPIVIDAKGELNIDYRKDLYKLMKENEHSYQEGDDIRYFLTDNYPIVPAYSLPYTLQDGEPVFNTKQ
jgi:hypothetical protein